MNPEVLIQAIEALRALHQAGKSNRALLAKNIKDEVQLKNALSLRFKKSVGEVVKVTLPQGSIRDCQELHIALLKAFPAEARGESTETLAVAV